MTDLELSPDGRWVYIELEGLSLKRNAQTSERWLARTGEVDAIRRLPTLPAASIIGWSADSRMLLFLERHRGADYLGVYEVATRRHEIRSFPILPSGARHYGFLASPNRTHLVYLATRESHAIVGERPTHGLEGSTAIPDWLPASGTPPMMSARPPRTAIWMLDLRTGRSRAVSDTIRLNIALDRDDVDGGAWGTWFDGGRRLVFPAAGSFVRDTGEHYPYAAQTLGLFVIDPTTGATQQLLSDSMARRPRVSPTGSLLAYQSGEDRLVLASLDRAHSIATPLRSFHVLPSDRAIWDGERLCVHASGGIRLSLYCARSEADTTLLDEWAGLASYETISAADPGHTVAVTREDIAHPPEILAGPITGLRTIVSARAINPRLVDALQSLRVDSLVWRSKDDHWALHAIVLLPGAIQPGHQAPLIVANPGGPNAVRSVFNANLGETFPDVLLALRGVVVVYPFTRGRPGFGHDFYRANEIEHSVVGNMTDDAIGSVDAAMRRWPIDSSRLGIVGFSWGGAIAQLAITRTNRFRAASLGDPIPGADLVWMAFHHLANPVWRDWKRRVGFGNPLDSSDLHRLEEESALHRARHVETPNLIETGSLSPGADPADVWFEAMRAEGVPCELVVYPRSAHAWGEPRFREESYERNLDWFKYWLLDQQYSQGDVQRHYDAWRSNRRAVADPRWMR